MVLYQQDFLRTGARVHYDTRNDSFIRMSIVLQRMGIKNNKFFLALYQPELAHVDPHDPHLDEQTKAKITVEAKTNPWYFFREIIKIPIAGGDVIPFQLNRGNLAALWTFFNDIDYGSIQPRQTGKTYTTQSIVTCFMFIMARNATVAMVTKDQTLISDNVRRLKELRDTIPPYLLKKSGRDWDRQEGVSYTELNTFYRTATTPIDEKSAYKVLRGSNPAMVHFDEIAFINYNWIMVPSIVNATLAAADQVRATGVPCPLIYTTTAGDPSTKPGAYALALFQNALPFSEALYDLNDRSEIFQLMEKTGSRKMLYLEFSYRQLGKTDQWFHDASTRTEQSKADIAKDLLNQWVSGTDKAVIPDHLLVKIRENRRDPNYIDYGDGFIVRWYQDRNVVESESFMNRPMIMGMDTSENVGRDYTTFTLMDPRDMKVLATCRSNLVNTMQVGKHVFSMLQRYPNLVWIPERNNTGIGIIDYVMEQLQNNNMNPFLRIYNEVVQNKDEPKYKDVNIYDFTEIVGPVRSTFGFRTTGTGMSGGTRNLLYKIVLMKAVEMNHSRLYDSTLINELCNLTVKNGRIDHPDGCHDDTTISLLLASFLVYFGKNLQLYGIPPGEVLQFVSSTGSAVSPQERDHQLELRRRINELETLIAANPATILKASYERELSMLRPLVDETITSVNPLAVTQVRYEEQEAREQSGSNIGQLKAFADRFYRARF